MPLKISTQEAIGDTQFFFVSAVLSDCFNCFDKAMFATMNKHYKFGRNNWKKQLEGNRNRFPRFESIVKTKNEPLKAAHLRAPIPPFEALFAGGVATRVATG